jgi:salicylate 5-hydroxylase small subunit
VSESTAMAVPAGADIATWFAVQQLHAEVARVLDAGDFARWPDFFPEDAMYLVQSRENFDRGLPLATIRLESHAMLRDRVVGATDTMFHDPYYQRHIVGAPVILGVHDGEVEAEAAYLVVRTHRDAMPELLSVGRYLDRLVRADGRWLIHRRSCIFDNDLLPNSLIYPI